MSLFMTQAVSPDKADMALVKISETGTATIRDKQAENATVLNAQVGYDTQPVGAHHYSEQNSFVLSYDGECYFADSCESEYHNTWDFTDAQGNKYTQARSSANNAPLNKLVQYPSQGNFTVLASDCAAAYGPHFKRAERVWITAFPHAMFMIDRVETDIPMKMTSHFVINNRDNELTSKMKDSVRLVFRRGQGAIKFFTFADESMELKHYWGHIHDNSMPNPSEQDGEGSAEIFDYVTDFGTSHLIIHPFVLQETNEIVRWHIKNYEPNVYRILNNGNTHAWILTLHPEEKEWFSLSEENLK